MSLINIINITSQEQLFQELNRWNNGGNIGEYLFLMTSATWCGPCKTLKEHFKKLLTQERELELPILYIDIDDDDFSDFVTVYGINSIPTGFVLKRNIDDMSDSPISDIMDISRLIEQRISGFKPDEYAKYI
jgi:thiol-disulfide isomerase/thioredoxin